METTEISVKKLLDNREILVKEISKNDFRDLLYLATKEPFFTFNKKLNIQVEGVTMESPPRPILTKIFLSYHKESQHDIPIIFESP